MVDISLSLSDVSDRTLGNLMDEVHDWWFDLDSVKYCTDSQSIALCLGRSKKAPYDREITVRGVGSLDIEDKAQIGLYDLDDITYDAANNQMVFKSTMPLRLVLHLLDGWKLTCKDRR